MPIIIPIITYYIKYTTLLHQLTSTLTTIAQPENCKEKCILIWQSVLFESHSVNHINQHILVMKQEMASD